MFDIVVVLLLRAPVISVGDLVTIKEGYTYDQDGGFANSEWYYDEWLQVGYVTKLFTHKCWCEVFWQNSGDRARYPLSDIQKVEEAEHLKQNETEGR